ncbi:hypothetical protein Psuf_037240 [Phytohabitans suffuscus]|uniref:SseB protein N-terminal domain-containing protein n=1 Tax=Phytohabitans suffuscus TaxID=624315 RepID=A0A6F8YKD2_9ACTN|nr:SseB family protein [Phytohabitans suffuscus]BCB86411.1 hypothetical protein Psuf_037240 [Phytohabitans suffuscus]
MTEWEPATEAEAAMREALRGSDQEEYFRVLARAELLLPVSADSITGQSPVGWGTWTTSGRTHVLAFTSGVALQACLAENAGSARRMAYQELAAAWPNLEWWLAVNPGLPIEGYLPAWFVTQLARGDVRLPGRSMAARARMEKAESAARARATAVVPGRIAPPGAEPTSPASGPVPTSPAGAGYGASTPGGLATAGAGGLTTAGPGGLATPTQTGLTAAGPGGLSTPPTSGLRGGPERGGPAGDTPGSPSFGPGASVTGPSAFDRGSAAGGFGRDGASGGAGPSGLERGGAGGSGRDGAPGGAGPSGPDRGGAGGFGRDGASGGAGSSGFEPGGTPGGGSGGFGRGSAEGGGFGRGSAAGGGFGRGGTAGGGESDFGRGNAPGGESGSGRGNGPGGGASGFGGPGAGSGGFGQGSASGAGSNDFGRGGAGQSGSGGFGPGGAGQSGPGGFGQGGEDQGGRRPGDPAQTPSGLPRRGGLTSAGDQGGPGTSVAAQRGFGTPGESGAGQSGPVGAAPSGAASSGAAAAGAAALAGGPGPANGPGNRPAIPDRHPVGGPPAGAVSPLAAAPPSAIPDQPAGLSGSGGSGLGLPRRVAGSGPAIPLGPIGANLPPISPGPAQAATAAPTSAPPASASPASGLLASGLPASGPPASATSASATPTSVTPTSAPPDSAPSNGTGAGAPRPWDTPPATQAWDPGTTGTATQARDPNSTTGTPTQAWDPNTTTGTPTQAWDPNTTTGTPTQAWDPNTTSGTPTQPWETSAASPLPRREPAPPPASASAPTPAPPPPPPIDLKPANDVEKSLLAAATEGSTDTFLSTLLLAKVLLPVSPVSADGTRPGEPGFAWLTETIDGEPYVVVFTSNDRLRDHLGETIETIDVKFMQLIKAWPDPAWSFAVNPSTPVGAKLPGAQILALANWAADVGLGGDTEEIEPAARPAKKSTTPDPSQPTMMQKVVAPSQVDYYIERGYDRVSGFVHRANEVAHLNTPVKMYAALGLSYAGSAFKRDADEIFVLRWPAYRPSLYRIPYGGQNEPAMRAMEGWVIERAPFRATGSRPATAAT